MVQCSANFLFNSIGGKKVVLTHKRIQGHMYARDVAKICMFSINEDIKIFFLELIEIKC